MKVLAISSSPRRGGNSDVLCDEFLKGAAKNGHETRKIRLAKKKIAPCSACYGCPENHIRNKTFYLIVTAADPQHSAADETLADFRGYLRCLPDAKEAGVIFGTGTWDKGDVYRHPSLKQAYEMGKEI